MTKQSVFLITTALIFASGCVSIQTVESEPVQTTSVSNLKKCSEQRGLDKVINESAGFEEDEGPLRYSHPRIDC